jgi:hypothetical protein
MPRYCPDFQPLLQESVGSLAFFDGPNLRSPAFYGDPFGGSCLLEVMKGSTVFFPVGVLADMVSRVDGYLGLFSFSLINIHILNMWFMF